MKDWPDFDDNGDLPSGIHQVTLTEVIEHFGRGTPQRRIVARRLEYIYTLAAKTGHFKRDGTKRGIVEVIKDDKE